MNLLEQKILQLRKQNKKVLSAFVTYGFPDVETTEQIVRCLVNFGVDIVELGFPFTDPIADGVTIQYSSQQALKHDISMELLFDTVKRIKKDITIPVVLMSYLNPIYQYGFEECFSRCQEKGIDGIIIPDMIPEEGKEYEKVAKKYNLATIYLLAPTSTRKRRKLIYTHSKGFVYVVSVTGITGARKHFPTDLCTFLETVRQETTKPLMLGFGISSPKQITPIRKYIDGIIIGSAIINMIREYKQQNMIRKIMHFIKQFKTIL